MDQFGAPSSELIREALAGYLEADRAADIDRRIVESYTRRPQDDLLGAEATALGMVTAEPWERAIAVLHAVLVVPATRRACGIPTEVALGREDGMPEDCVLSFDNLGVVPKELLTERITRLRPAKLAELCAALDVATDC